MLAAGSERAGERFIADDTYASVTGTNPAVGGWVLEVTAAAGNADEVDVSIDVFRRTSADPPDAFALAAPLTGARLRTGANTFSWVGARNAESYALLIDDRVVKSGIPREAASVTVDAPAVGQHSWRIAAVNQFGRTLSERRLFTGVAGFKYVALGDSFSAGEGVPPYFEPANRCHRSTRAYPVFVQQPGVTDASLFGLRGPALGVSWGFQACSGAVTGHLLDDRQGTERFPQLAADVTADPGNANRLPVDANTGLVTVTIGGNDMKFAKIVLWCGTRSASCESDKYEDTGKTLPQYLRGLRDDVAPTLTKIYQRIRQQAPNARVLVLGYPHLFPATADEQNCVKLKQRKLPKLGVFGFTNAEQSYLRQATAEFNQTIAARAQEAGVEFVPVDGYFAGHEPCGSGGEWVNAYTPKSVRDRSASDQSFHPNEKGHEHGYAAAVNDTLNPGPSPDLTLPPNLASAKVTGAGKVALAGRSVTCPAGPRCAVLVEARASVGSGAARTAAKKLVVIGRATLVVAPGTSREVTFTLTPDGRRALMRAKRLRASVAVAAYRAGHRTASTAVVTLLSPKNPKKVATR